MEKLYRSFPVCGKDKFAPLLWRQGFADVSVPMVGCLRKGLVEGCNGAWWYEFHARTGLRGNAAAMNSLIDDRQDTCNADQTNETPGSSQMS